ncbi:hypothetical protein DEGR_38750 (plasmid) [Deinococcus grandis]|nr:hypothetical protein DEGR_38750 [Deinococcus grandis]
MLGKLLIGAVQLRFVAAGVVHASLEVVRNDDVRDTAENARARTCEAIQSGTLCVRVTSA